MTTETTNQTQVAGSNLVSIIPRLGIVDDKPQQMPEQK